MGRTSSRCGAEVFLNMGFARQKAPAAGVAYSRPKFTQSSLSTIVTNYSVVVNGISSYFRADARATYESTAIPPASLSFWSGFSFTRSAACL